MIEELRPLEPREIDLEEGMPFICSIKMGNYKPPIQIDIEAPAGKKVTFYGSFDVTIPTAFVHSH